MTEDEFPYEIPDEIEYRGKKIVIDKDEYKRLVLESGKRVLGMAGSGPLKVKINEKLFSIIDFTDIIKIDPDYQGTSIHLGNSVPKIKDGLVGMGGIYYEPKNMGAESVESVVDSWNWLFTKENFPKRNFENFIEFSSILYWITSGRNQIAISHVMSMAVDLKILFDRGVDVSEKVTEIISKIKGNMRTFNKMKDKEKTFALLHINDMTLTIADILAETRIAIVANSFGLDVKMRKTPDVLIDGIRVEAKFDRRALMNDNGFDNKVTKGLKQGGELVAIFTGSFDIKKLKDKKLTWLGTDNLRTSLTKALDFCKSGKKCVLLFTGTSQGEIGRVAIIRD